MGCVLSYGVLKVPSQSSVKNQGMMHLKLHKALTSRRFQCLFHLVSAVAGQAHGEPMTWWDMSTCDWAHVSYLQLQRLALQGCHRISTLSHDYLSKDFERTFRETLRSNVPKLLRTCLNRNSLVRHRMSARTMLRGRDPCGHLGPCFESYDGGLSTKARSPKSHTPSFGYPPP